MMKTVIQSVTPTVNALCVQGAFHRVRGVPCQDAVGTWRSEDGHLAVVVAADGAGSRKFAKESAEAAVKSVIELFRDTGNVGLSDEETISALFRGQDALRLPKEDLGTTLLFAAVKDGEYLAGHIGDGVILKRENGAFSAFSEPENGEFSYLTFFLPTSDSKHLRLYRGAVSPGASFLLATDGVSGALFDMEAGTAAPACEKIDTANRSLPRKEFLKLLSDALQGVFAEISRDDKSIAVLSI